jgi:hypothetical protein
VPYRILPIVIGTTSTFGSGSNETRTTIAAPLHVDHIGQLVESVHLGLPSVPGGNPLFEGPFAVARMRPRRR